MRMFSSSREVESDPALLGSEVVATIEAPSDVVTVAEALVASGLLDDDQELVVTPLNPQVDLVAPAPTVTVVIPALNEAANIVHVIQKIPSWVNEVIVVDGRSTDGTADAARGARPGVKVIDQLGSGKGHALAMGFAAAQSDIIVMLDADGSTDPGEIPRFIAALRTGADFAKGTRFMIGGGSDDISPLRRTGNWLLGATVNVLWKAKFSDLCYGYNAFWRHLLPTLHVDCNGFEVETLLNIKAARAGLRIVEVPSHEANRLSGSSNLSAHRDGLRVLRTIVAERIRPS